MSEPMDVWVARDMGGRIPLNLYLTKPSEWDGRRWEGWDCGPLPSDWFPDLKPGECRRMRLVDAPEKGEEKGE